MRFGYRLVHVFVRSVLTLIAGMKVHGHENLPANGAVIVASNHIAMLDPPVIGVSIKREAHFAAKIELFKNPFLRKLITYLNTFPVNRSGFDFAALKKSLEVLKSQGVLIMFPEGTRSRTGEMLPFRKGIGFLVEKTRAPVLPVFVSGTDDIRKGLFKPGGITVKIGKAICGLAEKYQGEDKYEKMALEIRKAVLALKNYVA